MKNNVIPRNFHNITVKILVPTSKTAPGDIILVSKNDFGYIGYNRRTNRHFYLFASMLRNKEICQFVEVMA